jgi:glycine/D-amino acid oxidase-like deaminating enzyme
VLRRESRVIGVETRRGRFDAGAVVVAAGAWAPRLVPAMGLHAARAAQGHRHGGGTRPPSCARPHGLHRQRAGELLPPEGGGLTLVGVPCQEWDIDPDALGTGLPPHAAGVGAGILTHRIPAMEAATLARGYRAFDCYSADRHAILGPVDGVDGLYLATAFSGSGFKIAPRWGSAWRS